VTRTSARPCRFNAFFRKHNAADLRFFGDVALEDFAFMIDRAPQIMRLAVDLHEHLIKMPAPVTEALHPAHPLPPDVRRKQRSEPIPPEWPDWPPEERFGV
jgi:hypothetical protein